MNLDTLKREINVKIAERDFIVKTIESDKEKIEHMQSEYDTIIQAQAFVQSVAKSTQEQLSIELENIVNLALQTIFPNQYTFKLEYEMARGKTEARFVLYDNKKNPIDPLNALGGGCCDVICFALRVSLFTLGSTDKVIIMDEPMKFLSSDLRSRMSELIKTFTEKLDCQIIQVTHIPEFEENANVIRIKKVKGVSEVA